VRVWSDRAIRAALAYSHSAEAVPSTAAIVLSTEAAALSKVFLGGGHSVCVQFDAFVGDSDFL
jgi:hypothetical protein